MKGVKDFKSFEIEIDQGISIISKFKENFFIAKLMDEQNKMLDFQKSVEKEEVK